jgi:hypothetical protein
MNQSILDKIQRKQQAKRNPSTNDHATKAAGLAEDLSRGYLPAHQQEHAMSNQGQSGSIRVNQGQSGSAESPLV